MATSPHGIVTAKAGPEPKSIVRVRYANGTATMSPFLWLRPHQYFYRFAQKYYVFDPRWPTVWIVRVCDSHRLVPKGDRRGARRMVPGERETHAVALRRGAATGQLICSRADHWCAYGRSHRYDDPLCRGSRQGAKAEPAAHFPFDKASGSI